MNDIYSKIVKILKEVHRIDVSMYEKSYLLSLIESRVENTLSKNIEDYYDLLEASKEEGDIFLQKLHINYSEFFRNPLTFAVLERILIPDLIQNIKNNKRKELRIWSAACASGQEVYSLAILLEEFKKITHSIFSYRIFGTDCSQSIIEEAQKGRYTFSDLRNLHIKYLDEWFIKQDEIYVIKPALNKNIDFSLFDLFDEKRNAPSISIFADFDLVICSNLLYYYKPAYQKIILKKLANSLSDGGYFVTGEAEREIVQNYNFEEIYPQSAIFKKS